MSQLWPTSLCPVPLEGGLRGAGTSVLNPLCRGFPCRLCGAGQGPARTHPSQQDWGSCLQSSELLLFLPSGKHTGLGVGVTQLSDNLAVWPWLLHSLSGYPQVSVLEVEL